MKDLLKIAFTLAAVFLSTFVIMRMTGWVTEADVRFYLAAAHDVHPAYLVALVIILLFVDLFIAVPTLATVLLAGYFLGPMLGALASIMGLAAMGCTGYGLGRRYGSRLLVRLYKDEVRLAAIHKSFENNGLVVLFVCQALPILPEVSCCLAGTTKMPFPKFMFGFAVGTIPFAVIAAYAGSISTLSDPTPAIIASIGITATLWVLWTLLKRRGENL